MTLTPLEVNAQLTTISDFRSWFHSEGGREHRREYEAQVVKSWADLATSISLLGYCQACQRIRSFTLDATYGDWSEGNGFRPNWRERLECHGCGLNNRARAVVAVLRDLGALDGHQDLWIGEATTGMYSWLSQHVESCIGSEFLDLPNVTSGTIVNGVRHEDATATSFADSSLDLILSFDVLEHVPDYKGAIAEWLRILRSGGRVVWTAPFLLNEDSTRVRAKLDETGAPVHLLEPEYHGDPLGRPGGVLCFQEFGWDVLQFMRSYGFQVSQVRLIWSVQCMNIGPEQVVIVGQKN
jgi:SAM-dependent methyltransferase